MQWYMRLDWGKKNARYFYHPGVQYPVEAGNTDAIEEKMDAAFVVEDSSGLE